VKRIAIAGILAALVFAPAQAQNATLDQVSREIAEIKAKNERLEAEVEYLKENAKAQRKEGAIEAVEVANLKSATSKFSWSGDFRYRNEQIETAASTLTDEYTRGRDRIRLRFGVTAKINDTITGRFQIATAGGVAGDPRSTNQTLGEDWSRKSVGIDLAYVDWKATSFMNVQLGKMPQPWTRTTSYFWDGDITPEGAAVKFASGNLFASGFYDWLNERHSNTPTSARSDSKLVGGQIGWKQPIGKTTLTLAAGYFDVTNVKGEITSGTAFTPAATPAVTCAANGAFFSQTTSAPNVVTNANTNTNGNSTYDTNGAAASGCSALLSDFGVINALAQLDFVIGSLPVVVFADYMQNSEAEVNVVAGEKLDTAYSAGVTFGKASAPKSWEAGVAYQQTEADAVFGQFHDSDFGDGKTDTNGYVVKAAFAPAANWTISGTLFINKLNNETGSATTTDLDYKRLQLDLNFKF
jgi:outer membrane murein-binding lipoprotein Lpp